MKFGLEGFTVLIHGYCYGVQRHFQQYFSYIVVVSFIGEGYQITMASSPHRTFKKCAVSSTFIHAGADPGGGGRTRREPPP